MKYLFVNINNFLITFFTVPGDGGSQFEAKLTGKPSVVHYWCERRTDNWFPLWLNIELLAPYVLDCTVDNLRSGKLSAQNKEYCVRDQIRLPIVVNKYFLLRVVGVLIG